MDPDITGATGKLPSTDSSQIFTVKRALGHWTGLFIKTGATGHRLGDLGYAEQSTAELNGQRRGMYML